MLAPPAILYRFLRMICNHLVIKCGALTNKQGIVYINASVATVGYIYKFDSSFCGEGARIVGAKEVKCQSDETWDNPAPDCEGSVLFCR